MKHTKAQRKAQFDRERLSHHRALESLRADTCTLSGVQLWRKLRALETMAHACATAYCNGERVRVSWPNIPKIPFEYNFRDSDQWENVVSHVRDCVRQIFGRVPHGFFVNADARGYALKIDPDAATVPEGMHTDWGRNGILGAEIN